MASTQIKNMELKYYCDNKRHLICVPYSIDNLHVMASRLNIKRCWFHRKNRNSHYDIPKTRIEEIKSKCIVVSDRELLRLINSSKRV